jgi:spore coat protein A
VRDRRVARGRHESGPCDAGLKDTVDLCPGEAVEGIARFDGQRRDGVISIQSAIA